MGEHRVRIAGVETPRTSPAMSKTQAAWRWGALIVPLAVALALRAQYFGQWPIGFRPTLEFDSANAARTIFLALTSDHAAGWQQAWLAAHPGRFIEPPLLQTLTALTYLPGGVERPWTAAVFNAVFWFAAAALLFVAMRRMVGWWGATLAASYLFLAPFAVAVSQSFQPEALLVLGLALVIWYATRGDVTASHRLVVAAIIGGVAGLTKPGPPLAIIAMVFTWSALQSGSLAARWRWLRLVALIGLAALPSIAYAYLALPDQFGYKVLPGLLLTPGYYTGWLSNVLGVVGIVPLVGGVLGFLLSRRVRLLGLAFGVAYLADSAIFTWHTMTHDYYQVPLLVMIAVGLGGLGETLVKRTAAAGREWAFAIAGGVAIAIVMTYVMAPKGLLGATPGRYPNQARFEAVGRLLGAGERVVAYSDSYGYPLMYYGRLVVAWWPTASQKKFEAILGVEVSDAARLAQLIKVDRPHYFVITLDGSQGLEDLLGAQYPMVVEETGLRVHDLTRTLAFDGSQPPPAAQTRQ